MTGTLRLIARANEPNWEKPRELSDMLWRILYSRGCESYDQAKAFLNPSRSDILSPYELYGMREAVSSIKEHISKGSKICVWGDYDVDGISATAILLLAFERLGVKAAYHIPSRQLEGYGFNEDGVLGLDAQLLISVDCGISEKDIIDKAVNSGMTVIVTDHHREPAELPQCVTVSPLLGQYPNRNLCGAGVALKLAMALCPDAFDLIDIAAIATIADVVPLKGENRAIVSRGLDLVNREMRPGIDALVKVAGTKGKITSQTVAFQLAPRLNASGRVSVAESALKLMLTNDKKEAESLASELNALNGKRRDMETRVLSDCDKMLAQYDLAGSRSVILAGDGWNKGVVGLAASRLVERYNMPAILLAREGDVMTGSCRSIPGCDIHMALTKVKRLLTRFGGHSQAAGLSINASDFPEFRRELDAAIASITPEEAFEPFVEYDCEANIGDVTPEFIAALDALEPTGMGNPQIALMSSFDVRDARKIGKNLTHASFLAYDGASSIRGVWFSGARQIASCAQSRVKCVYTPFLNEFRGERNPQLQVKTLVREPESALNISADAEEALVNSFITQKLYNAPIAENRAGVTADELNARLLKPRGTLIVCADVLSAREILKRLDRPLDVFTGSYPDDSRAFNALCVAPSGELAAGYDFIVCAGAPAWLIGVFVRNIEGFAPAKWLKELPSVDETRKVYIACRDICLSALSFPSVTFLGRELSERAGVSGACALAGVMALRDMGLVRFEPSPVRLEMNAAVKTDPKSSGVFMAIQRLKAWGGA